MGNILSADNFSPCLQNGFIRSVENVILSNIINNVDGTSVVCDVWHMECLTDDMVDGKANHIGDTT